MRDRLQTVLRWLLPHRLNVWRWEHGILTGRWTQAEIDDQNRRAHDLWLRLQDRIE